MSLKEFVEENFKINESLGYPIKYAPCGIYEDDVLLCYVPVKCYLVQEKTYYKKNCVNNSYKVVYPLKVKTLGETHYTVPKFVRGTNSCYNSQVVHDISDNFEDIANRCEKFNYALLADKNIEFVAMIKNEISSYYDSLSSENKKSKIRKRERD